MKILIIDDSATARLFVKKIAKMILADSDDISFIEADSGETGILALKEHDDIDLILSDVNMPVMSGFTFMNSIQLDEKFKSIPVVFITSISNACNSKSLINIGAKAVIPKPLKMERMKAVFESLGLVEFSEECWG